MLTRKSFAILAAITLVCFVVAGIVGQHHHGVVQAIGDIAWTGLLIGIFLLIVGSVVVLVRSRRPQRSN